MLRDFSNSWISFLRSVLPLPSVTTVSTTLDWVYSSNVKKDISVNTSFLFANVGEGFFVSLLVRNVSGTEDLVVEFPSGILASSSWNLVVEKNTANVYTFFSINGKIYSSSVAGLSL